MNGEDQEFEKFLRGFEPRRPRSLPLVTSGRSEIRRLAAAAIVLIAIGASLWLGLQSFRTKFANRRPVATQGNRGATRSLPLTSSTTLTRAALEDEKQFDAEIDELARLTFPCCEGPKSSLAALAKP